MGDDEEYVRIGWLPLHEDAWRDSKAALEAEGIPWKIVDTLDSQAGERLGASLYVPAQYERQCAAICREQQLLWWESGERPPPSRELSPTADWENAPDFKPPFRRLQIVGHVFETLVFAGGVLLSCYAISGLVQSLQDAHGAPLGFRVSLLCICVLVGAFLMFAMRKLCLPDLARLLRKRKP